MTATDPFLPLGNCQAVDRGDVPELPPPAFRAAVVGAYRGGWRLAALFGHTAGAGAPVELYAVLADRSGGLLHAARTTLSGDAYPALTPDCPQAHLFERELAEQYGVVPEGHPWLKPVRFVTSWRPGHDAWGRPAGEKPLVGVMDFYRVEGEEIHEVAVGPVHAGVIEPGHFRFQCHGELVYHLEISLGYQHRGVEKRLLGGPDKRTVHYMETLAGDTSVGHATAYCQAVETLAGCEPPLYAQRLRGVGLELERLANHTGDLGALANDVAFLPTSSYCGRLRGDFLNATAALCGSRFGRGLVRPGGVRVGLDAAQTEQLVKRLEAALKDVSGAARLSWDTPSVQARYEDTGPVTRADCEALGMVGVAARACGVDLDVRADFPAGIFRFVQIPVSTAHTGDVFARAYVRWLEIQRSGEYVLRTLRVPGGGALTSKVGAVRPDAFVVSLVEGWRGEICHVALTDGAGRFARYKVVDPSFHNWYGLALALRDQQIFDFPLCNKSFNLSYCGHDL